MIKSILFFFGKQAAWAVSTMPGICHCATWHAPPWYLECHAEPDQTWERETDKLSQQRRARETMIRMPPRRRSTNRCTRLQAGFCAVTTTASNMACTSLRLEAALTLQFTISTDSAGQPRMSRSSTAVKASTPS